MGIFSKILICVMEEDMVSMATCIVLYMYVVIPANLGSSHSVTRNQEICKSWSLHNQ